MSNFKKNLILIVSSFVIIIIICELILRFFNLGYNNAPVDHSRIYHHINPKSFKFTSYSPSLEWKSFQIFYDNNGYRVAEQITENKEFPYIYFLGDSFTQAVQVEYENTFIGLLQKKYPELNLINLGVTSYSPLIYLIQIKNIIKEKKPKYIIIQLFGNDISNDNSYIQYANSKDLDNIEFIDGQGNNWIRFYRYSYLLRLFRAAQQIAKFYILDNFKNENSYNVYEFKNKIGKPNNITTNVIKKINEIARHENIIVYYFYVPNKNLVNKKNCCENDENYFKVKNYMKNTNFIDLSNYLSNSDQDLFFNKDIHFTIYGHKKISEALDDQLFKKIK